jgi:pimeloyl-ACP methyl ester carboxylesterase
MSPVVELGPVRTHFEDDGAGPPLVLLHPGLADARAFDEHVPALAERFRVLRPDRRGHGRTPDVEGPFTYDDAADDTIAFLDAVAGEPAHVLGHSVGAPVGLMVALRRPDLVRSLVFGAGVFHHEGWTPGAIDLDEETTAFFADWWGAVAPDGPQHFAVVKAKVGRMNRDGPTLVVEDLAAFAGPVLITVGERDGEIHREHLHALRDGLPDARLEVLPGMGHGGIDTDLVLRFLAEAEGGAQPAGDLRPAGP